MMEIFNGFIGKFKVVSDGRRAVGRSVNNQNPKGGEDLKVIQFNPSAQQRLVNDYDDNIQEIGLLEKERRRYYQKYRNAKRRFSFLKKTANLHIIIWGLLGLVVALAGAAGKLLEDHGPTVTVLGTVIASFAIVAFGIGFSILGMVMCKHSLVEFIGSEVQKMQECRHVIHMIDEEILNLQEANSRAANKIGETELSELL